MTVADPRVGNDCSLFWNTGTTAVPVWLEFQAISDVSLSTLEVSMAEVVTRSSDWAVNLAAKFRAEIEFRWLWGEDKATLEAYITTFFGRAWSDIAIMDSDMVANPGIGEGLRGPFYIAQMPRSEPNEEAVTVDMFRLVPALAYDIEDTENLTRFNPMWHVVVVAASLARLGGPGYASPNAVLTSDNLKTSLDPQTLYKLQRKGRLYVDSYDVLSVSEAIKVAVKLGISTMPFLSKLSPHRPVLMNTASLDQGATPKKK